eukprot:scaffold4381_cov48-Attheya_sp.AAC.2
MARNNTNAVNRIGEEQESEPDPREDQNHAPAFERKKRPEDRHQEGVRRKRNAPGLPSQLGNEDQPQKEKHRSSGRSTRETESSRGLPSSHRNEDRRRENSRPSKRAVKELEGLPRRNWYDEAQRIKHHHILDAIIRQTGSRAPMTNNGRSTETQTLTPKKVEAPKLPRNTRMKETSSRYPRPSTDSQGSPNNMSSLKHPPRGFLDEEPIPYENRSRRKRQQVQNISDDYDTEEPPEENEMRPRQPPKENDTNPRGQRVAPFLAKANPVYYPTDYDSLKHPKKLQTEKKNSMLKSLLVTLLVASVIGLVTVIVMALVNSRSNESQESGSTSTGANRATCIDTRIKYALLSDPSTLNDSTSPQSRARDWIANEDPGGLLACNAPNLIQRWALATFYFATTKDNTNWLGCGYTNDLTDMKCTAHELTGLRKDGTPLDIDTPINAREYNEIPNQNQWLKATNECTWYGVECFGFDEVDVTDLSLDHNGLKGTIPKEIGLLNYLELIFLTDNSLTGTIPTEVGMLDILRQFRINYNDLTGTIPEEVYTRGNLEVINVKSNMLSGTISSGIGRLKKLLAVYYADNLIQGSIPSQLGNDVLLGDVWLFENRLTGSLPSELGSLTMMNTFDAYENEISGTLPPEIGNLQELRNFRMDLNSLEGKLPDELYNLVDLEELILESNLITGTISSKVGQFSKMKLLYLSNNYMTGTIPTEVGKVVSLGECNIQLPT